MANRIEGVCRAGVIPDKAILEHTGFSKWDSYSSKGNHASILQVLSDSRDEETKDVDGVILPTLVYLAREKRPQHFHNFKAGAMNALIRVSSEISNGPIILNVDCDMYSNNSNSIQDTLCFFMDEEKSHEIAFVQFPQSFENTTKNELYGSLRVIDGVEFHGMDGNGGPLYTGTGCFHRRDTLCGREFSKDARIDLKSARPGKMEENVHELEERLEILASCTYEENTQWGNEIGLKYGCPVEDVLTGLTIQCKGWKSVYYKPERKGFLGVTATTLDQTLVQHKRWSEGDLMILFSKYSPVWYGLGKLNPGLLLGYLTYCLWSPNCVATLYYSIVPSLYLLKGISLFPQMRIGSSEVWILIALLVVAWSSRGALGIRFVIDREECFSHKVEMGETVHFSFVVIKSEGSWHYSEEGVDLVVKGPSGEQIHDFRDKISEKTEFVAHHEGVYRFCFTNKSPYHETIDFDLHAAHFVYHDEHAKDEHFKPLFEHIGKLEEALYNIQFEQHWLEAQTDRQAIVNEGMSKRAVYKALFESSALICVSILQVFLLKHLFERKLGQSRV